MKYSRAGLDLGLLSNQQSAMLEFWRDQIGLQEKETLRPVEGVVQHKLDLHGAVLKLNCVEMELPTATPQRGICELLLVRDGIDEAQLLQDPDGNRVRLVPRGYQEIDKVGIHLAVSEAAAFHRFFSQVLLLPRVSEQAYEWAGTTLSFAETPTAREAQHQDGIGYNYLTVQVMDTQTTHEQLVERGAKELVAPSDQHTSTDSLISFIADPDGNRIEISQRPDLVAAAGNIN